MSALSPEIVNIAKRFSRDWSLRTEEAPVLSLDFSWPSVGILDLLTFHIRGENEVSAEDRKIIKGASAYLAVMAFQCWEAFEVSVVAGENDDGIFLKAERDGKTLLFIAIEQSLFRILKDPPYPFPVIGSSERAVLPDHNYLSLFGIGLMTGLSPYAEGEWANEGIEARAADTEKTVRVLAKSTAEHFGRLLPGEQLGQVAELYLSNLIYPPVMIGEPLPGLQAVRGILAFLKEYNLPAHAVLELSKSFACSPDELISTAGLSFYSAMVDSGAGLEAISKQVLSVTQTLGNSVGLLRGTMIEVRNSLNLFGDWISEEELTKGGELRAKLEIQLGFLPWLKLPMKRLKDKKLKPLLQALSLFDLNGAVKILDEILSESPSDIDLRIQRTYLDLAQGDPVKGCEELKKLLSEPGAENEALLFHLWGLAELSLEKNEQALLRFKEAFQLRDTELLRKAEKANNFAWALILMERYDEALPYLDLAIKEDYAPVTALLNKAYVARLLNQEQVVKSCEEQLLKLAPTDRRVFRNLMLQQTL